jgi:hypothetical protein
VNKLCKSKADGNVSKSMFVGMDIHKNCLQVAVLDEKGKILTVIVTGAVLLISGIVISAVWAGYFAGIIIRENAILSGVSIKPADSVNVSTLPPVTLATHVERNNGTTGGQIPNNISKRNRTKSKWCHNDKQ